MNRTGISEGHLVLGHAAKTCASVWMATDRRTRQMAIGDAELRRCSVEDLRGWLGAGRVGGSGGAHNVLEQRVSRRADQSSEDAEADNV